MTSRFRVRRTRAVAQHGTPSVPVAEGDRADAGRSAEADAAGGIARQVFPYNL